MTDQVFFRSYQAPIRTCSVFELVRGSKRDPSLWLFVITDESLNLYALFYRMDVLLFFIEDFFSTLLSIESLFISLSSARCG